MKLTSFERLSLINQYEILKGIHADRESDYQILIKCLTDGYLVDFAAEAEHLQPELEDEVRKEVRQILDMFRALTPDGGDAGTLRFAGFDGNEETKHYAYASFLLEDLGLWKESQSGDCNSHSDMLPQYRQMLNEWEQCGDQWHPTAEEFERIAAVAPHQVKKG